MGTKRLLNIVGEHRGEVTQELEKHILEQTEQFALSGDGDIPPSGEAQRHDDLTLMCIANNMAAETPALIIRNDVDELTRVKALVSDYCQSMNCDRRQTRKIMLAIEEAVANVINYAYPKGTQGLIEIDITAMQATTAQTGDITIVISDNGQPFNPLAYHGKDVDQVIDDRQIGGLGIHLYQQIMDSVIYNRKDNKNILTLSKNITINGN
jgi:anti-sigma regulatory factor (Ser/Thr protein kinase)